MLKNWVITNFKSFSKRTEIELAPITVLAGANSSGKSTILQSILLLKQTVQYVPTSRSIGLNGPILKLGRFDDIKNVTTSFNQIGFEWELTEVGEYRQQGGQQSIGLMYYGMYPHTEVRSAKYNILFEVDDGTGVNSLQNAAMRSNSELRQLQPVLSHVNLQAIYVTRDEKPYYPLKTEVRLSRKVQSRQAQIPSIQATSANNLAEAQNLFNYKIDYLDSSTRSEVVQQKPDPQLFGATVQHFLPYQIGVIFNKKKDLAYKASVIITSGPHSHPYQYDSDAGSTVISHEISQYILGVLHEKIGDEQLAGRSSYYKKLFEDTVRAVASKEHNARDLAQLVDRVIRAADPRYRAAVRSSLTECQSIVEEKIVRTIELSSDVGFQASVPRIMAHITEQANTFFRYSIRYLGPLRDEPKPIYPLEAVANPTDVGYRGEHTAAVLDLNRDRPVTYIESRYAESPTSAQPVSATLHTAVVDWLTYLGVAEGVRTSDLGKMGHQLQVRTGGISREHDLTNVGVGVSQLLPIIVMALLSPIPSTLIFEQPELHLHPRVQTRLADFFISLGLSRRQCILETHSEYMIERLRRRIAETEGDSLQSQVKIYFTHRVEGNTLCEPVQVTKYGAIQNWPPDFFDQSQAETAEILKAAQRKIKADRNKINK